MKYRLFALILVLAVLLTGCQKKPQGYYAVMHNGKALSLDTVKQTVTHEDDVYTYTIQESRDTVTMQITYPNGKTMTVSQNKASGAGNSSGGLTAEEAERYLSEWELLDVVQQTTTEKHQFHLGYFLLGILLLGTGVFFILDPETAIYWRHMWWFKDAEPTDFAIGMTRLGGVVSAIGGVVLIVLSFFQ